MAPRPNFVWFLVPALAFYFPPNLSGLRSSIATPTADKQYRIMENGTVTQGEGKDPSSFLSEIIGNAVIVKLNSGVVYKGEACILQ